jgi:multidrug efflux system membrane fusion protein
MIQSDAMDVHSPRQSAISPAVHAPARQPSPPQPGQQPGHHHVLIWIILASIAAALAGVVYWRVHSQSVEAARAAAKPIAATPVVVANVHRGTLPIYLPELGTVTPLYTITVQTRVSGQLMDVGFQEGQIVQQGQVIADIDPRPFQAAVEQAQGQLAKDQATLENDQLNLKRYQQAVPGTFTPQQIDTQKATVDQDQGIVQSDQGTLDNAKVQLVYCKITSPITGRVGLRLIDPGNFVQPTDTSGIAVITQIQPITVVFSIADVDIPKVMGNNATVPKLECDAYNSDFSKKIATGYVYAVDSQIDVTTDKLKLKAIFDNKDYALFPNQFVNIQLLVDTLHKTILIPTAAVQRGPDGSTFVYVVKSDDTADIRNLTLGPTQGDQQAVTNGLAVGDQVITDGVDKLQEGSKVAPKPAPGATTQPSTQPSHHHHHQDEGDDSTSEATTRVAE